MQTQTSKNIFQTKLSQIKGYTYSNEAVVFEEVVVPDMLLTQLLPLPLPLLPLPLPRPLLSMEVIPVFRLLSVGGIDTMLFLDGTAV